MGTLYPVSSLLHSSVSEITTTHVDNSQTVMLPPDTTPRSCYFTYHPPSYNHFSTETPCASPLLSPHEPSSPDPANPLLAYREPQRLTGLLLIHSRTCSTPAVNPQRIPTTQLHRA